MNALLTLLYLSLCVGIVIFVPPLVTPYVVDYGVFNAFDAAKAVLLCTGFAAIVGYYCYKRETDGTFLLRLFASALIVRMVIALAIFVIAVRTFSAATPSLTTTLGRAAVGWDGDKYYLDRAEVFTKG